MVNRTHNTIVLDRRRVRLKIIFLDIDGVLNTPLHSLADMKKFPDFKPMDERCYGLNSDLIKNLKYILDETGAKIVVSSSWRHFHDYSPYNKGVDWRDVLAERCGYNPKDLFLGDTPSLVTRKMDDEGISEYTLRGREIKAWIDENKDSLGRFRYAILDDEVCDIVTVIKKCHVFKTDSSCGLTKEVADKVISFLNGVQ